LSTSTHWHPPTKSFLRKLEEFIESINGYLCLLLEKRDVKILLSGTRRAEALKHQLMDWAQDWS